MRFSISSSRRAALAVVVALAVLEVVTRTYLFGASRDLARFATYDQRAASGLRLAIVGNSAVDKGIDPTALGTPAELFTADASEITTWRHMADRYFFAPHRKVDLLLVGFFGST